MRAARGILWLLAAGLVAALWSPRAARAADCNANGVEDAEDLAAGSLDSNGNGIPDECDAFPPRVTLRPVPRTPLVTKVTEEEDGRLVWEVPVPAYQAQHLGLEMGVVLTSRSATCESDPGNCSGGERSSAGMTGCHDLEDNDADGLVDKDDPDCIGVQGWSFSVWAGNSFTFHQVTTEGTVAGLDTHPPGIRDSRGNFEHTAVAEEATGSRRHGVVTAIVLSFSSYRLLPFGDQLILIAEGDLQVPALEANAIHDVEVFWIPAPGQGGLRGNGQPVQTVVHANGTGVDVQVPGRVRVRLVASDTALVRGEFLRGDANDDARINIADAVWVLGDLFHHGQQSGCENAADANGDAVIDISDPVHLIRYQFLAGPPPPPPFPGCGPPPTRGLTCHREPAACRG